jgi:putative ABC transport system permease protein
MLVVDLVAKALTRSKSFSLIFILNFTLAIISLAYLQFFKTSMEHSLDSKAKILLGADMVIESRFAIREDHIEQIKQKLPAIKALNQGISTVSMIASKSRAKLMEVVRLGEGFPYYGGVTFHDNTTYPHHTKLPNANEAWVYQEVLDLLGVKQGDTIKIGDAHFRISKTIQDDSLKTISFSGVLPKIYLCDEGFKATNLLQFGSTARYKLNILFQEPFSNDQLEDIKNRLQESIDANLRLLSPNDGRDRLLSVMGFVTNFLSLVSLISFFLGLVGVIYLYSGFLRKHQKDMGILSDVGVDKRTLTLTYLLHLFVLIAFATLFVSLLMLLSSHALAPLIEKAIDFHFDLSLNYHFFLQSALLLLLLSLAIGLPLILPLLGKQKPSWIKRLLHFSPFIALLLLIAHSVTPARHVGLFFAMAILLLIALLFTLGAWILKRIDFLGHYDSLALSLAIKNITRQRNTSLSLSIAILLCTTFFTLIPQTGASLSSLLMQSIDEKPRFFVIDAKEEQIEELQDTVESMGASLENISPMIRGRVSKINGVVFTQPTNQRQRTTVNLSYRLKLKPSETIIQGVPFSGRYNSPDLSTPIELSIEERYAKRQGITLGDSITFDLLGLELEAKVVNIRSVEWMEFVPNFFFILQDGALNDAPKTMLATITSGDYNASKMVLKLSDSFPTLTVIDVKNLFETFATLVKSVTDITDKMSIYSTILGLLMSFIIIQYQMNLQKNNILRLKMIGINNSTIRNTFLIAFGLIALIASSVGIVLGTLGSYLISSLLFDSYWEFRADLLSLYLLFIPLLTLLIVSYFTQRIINQKENRLFGE